MAKNDNLKDFLTDVADAIREKKGTTEKINPQDFSDEIRGIESGGGITPCEWNDVNFYDYEGTILYSYTWDEFVEKNEMPPLPTHHKGLVCQEWNYTLEEVLEQGGRCDVGAIYTTISGKTEITIDARIDKEIKLKVNTKYLATVDWGDGNIQDLAVGDNNITHIYGENTTFVISLNNINLLKFIREINTNVVSIKTDKNTMVYASGTNCKNISVAFFYYGGLFIQKLTHINIPKKQSYIEANTFNNSISIKTISLPYGITNLKTLFDNSMFAKFHIPSTVNKISLSQKQSKERLLSLTSSSAYYPVIDNCLIEESSKKIIYAINNAIIPNYIEEIGAYAFTNSLQISCYIPDSVKIIGANAFYSLHTETPLYMGKNIETINNSAFGYSYFSYFDFRSYVTIPSLVNSNAFAGIKATSKIVVPDALYDEWIAATNWSTYASRIVKASEFVEPTNE